MQHFITVAGARHSYDDDVKVTIAAGVSKVTTAGGVPLVAPTDLQPATQATAAQLSAQQAAIAWA